MNKKRLLFLFVDGLGLGIEDPAVNPVYGGSCPVLEKLLRSNATPVDAAMGVEGNPQSATGQVALFTGVNAAAVMGRHVEGFPGPTLKAVIHKDNIFLRLSAMGLKSTFANAYFIDDSKEVDQWRVQSVTTVATLRAFGVVRDRHRMNRNEAVYQDIVRDELRARGYTGPRVSPAEAAAHLGAIVKEHDFTLFEYFQTDRAGHAGDPERSRRVLSLFDEFLDGLLRRAEAGEFVLMLTSDHGNIEDIRTVGHTMNPVPMVTVGPGADFFKGRISGLTDVMPALLAWFEEGRPGTAHGC